MNGPFVYPRPGQQPLEDAPRPLTSTIDSNRGGFKVLAPPTGLRDALGVQSGDFQTCGLDVRPDQRSPGERYSISLGLELDPGIDKNNDPRGRRPSGRRCDLHDFLQDARVWPSVRALVQWGSGATKFEALVDVLHGSILSVPASTLRVDVQYRVVSPPWEELPPGGFKLPTWRAYALVAYGNSGRVPTLTEIAQLENPQDFVDVPIPAFASTFTVLPVAGSSVSISQIGLGLGFGVPWNVSTPLTNVNQDNELTQITRFNGAEFVRVTNANAQGAAFAFLVFGLSL